MSRTEDAALAAETVPLVQEVKWPGNATHVSQLRECAAVHKAVYTLSAAVGVAGVNRTRTRARRLELRYAQQTTN